MDHRREKLGAYVDSMLAAASVIEKENPDYVLSPMLGSIPFIDAMAIASKDFDPSKVIYMPASSRIYRINDVIEGWYTNFLEHNVKIPDRFPKVLGIDEVVSGSSVMRCMKHIDAACMRKRTHIRQDLIDAVQSEDLESASNALRNADIMTNNRYAIDFSSMRENLRKTTGARGESTGLTRSELDFLIDKTKLALADHLVYRTIGIEDSSDIGKRHKSYEEAKKSGKIIPVPIHSIITMDSPVFCPVKFESVPANKVNKGGNVKFTHIVSGFSISPEYMQFLQDIANYVGKDPNKVAPVNMIAILDSMKYFPDQLD